MKKVHTDEQKAGLLTKVLARMNHGYLVELLCGWNAYTLPGYHLDSRKPTSTEPQRLRESRAGPPDTGHDSAQLEVTEWERPKGQDYSQSGVFHERGKGQVRVTVESRK